MTAAWVVVRRYTSLANWLLWADPARPLPLRTPAAPRGVGGGGGGGDGGGGGGGAQLLVGLVSAGHRPIECPAEVAVGRRPAWVPPKAGAAKRRVPKLNAAHGHYGSKKRKRQKTAGALENGRFAIPFLVKRPGSTPIYITPTNDREFDAAFPKPTLKLHLPPDSHAGTRLLAHGRLVRVDDERGAAAGGGGGGDPVRFKVTEFGICQD